jgi:hypothetical protein
VLQRLATEEFHDQEWLAILLPDFVDGANVGMIESRGCPGFAPEALEGLAVAGQRIGQEFQRDVAAEAQVFGFVHDTHAATAELFKDAVMCDGLPNHGEGIYPWNAVLGSAYKQVNS